MSKMPWEMYICQGDRTGCRMFARFDPSFIMLLGKPAKQMVRKFLDGDGSLKGTDFYHLQNFEEGEFKNECPRIRMALSYSPGWTIDRLKEEGLRAYLTDVVEPTTEKNVENESV